MIRKRSILQLLALQVALFPQYAYGDHAETIKSYHYTVPENVNDGWKTTHMSNSNIDSNLIYELFDQVINNTYVNIHGVLLVKNGKLVVEEYFPGRGEDGQFERPNRMFNRDTRHELHSVTKSVTAMLIGIAMDQNLISGVEEKIGTFFPEYADIFADRPKEQLRLKHFLSMTAGLSWDEWEYPYTDARNDLISMYRSHDLVRYVLERSVVTTPGTKFVYNGGLTIAIGQIIYKVSGLRADAFADRYLFAPLSITDYHWQTFSNGTVNTGGGLSLRPRDMAKIGSLVLNGGRWQGRQIVSEEWIKASTQQQAPTHDAWYAWWVPPFARWIFKKTPLEHNEYGYYWWLGSFRVRDRVIVSYRAEGRGGQSIFVFPDFQMVAVFTGWNDNELGNLQPLDMLQRYILPAVQ